ncbi:MAG: site-2 protease family protein [Clostridiales bacterium]|nr:site-2 protease family protein [Clostridiales bacterium]
MLLFGFGWARPVPVNSRNFKKFRRDDLLVSIAGVTLNFILFFFTTLIMVGLNQLIWKPEMWNLLGMPLLNQKDFLSFNGGNFYSIFTGENLLFIQESNGYLSYIPGMFEEYLQTPWLLYVQRFFMNFAMINLGLCLFNLLPIPPLDGYHVVNDIFLRGKLHIPAQVMQGLMIALLVIMFATDFISNLLGNAIYFVQDGVLSLILGIFGLG